MISYVVPLEVIISNIYYKVLAFCFFTDNLLKKPKTLRNDRSNNQNTTHEHYIKETPHLGKATKH